MMNKIKALLAFGLSVAMIAALLTAPSITAFASDTPPTVTPITLTLWGSQSDQEMLTTMAANFKKQYKNKKYNIKLGVCGEDVAKTTVLNDPDAAGDVFAFTGDQAAALQAAGVLSPITVNKDAITAENSAASIGAVTFGNALYAYPYCADTYFLYYNKSILSHKDVESLETIMQKKLRKGVVNFSMNMSSGLYGASFFLSAGCKLFGNNGRDAAKCDFNNKQGFTAAVYMMGLAAKYPKFTDYGANYDSAIVQNFKDRKLAAAVSKAWSAASIQAALGKDYGAVKLPTIKLNSKAAQMGSFATFKYYGVNSHSRHIKSAMKLAEFLTNEQNQKLRFKIKGAAPTNKTLALNLKELSQNPAAAANAAQAQCATLQPSIDQISNFWTPMASLGTSIENRKTTKATLQSDLNKLVGSIISRPSVMAAKMMEGKSA